MVVQLTRRLFRRPVIQNRLRVLVRNYQGEAGVASWLQVREASFCGANPSVRPWQADDFHREITLRSGWDPNHLWFAESFDAGTDRFTPIGAVNLAMRGRDNKLEAVVHWLAVVPLWRRKGVGGLLLAYLEVRCWELGFRQVSLESQTGWVSAIQFYRALGYRSRK